MNNISGVSPLSNAAKGTVYYDQNNGNSYIWNGKLWVMVASSSVPPHDYKVISSKSMVQYVNELGEI